MFYFRVFSVCRFFIQLTYIIYRERERERERKTPDIYISGTFVYFLRVEGKMFIIIFILEKVSAMDLNLKFCLS